MTHPTKALDVEAIHQAIDEECSSEQIGWRRARRNDVPTVQRLTQSPLTEEKLVRDGFSDESTLFYSLVFENGSGVIIFFVEFSTWQGRVLFLQQLVVPSESFRLPAMQLLAKIALCLDCVRLVWQHTEESRPMYKEMGASTLDGVLTLKLDRSSIASFTSSQSTSEVSMTVNDAIDAAIEPINISLRPPKLQLKRGTIDDLNDIRALIQGLADHVEESDSITTTADDLRLDGFETPSPLYYCLLLHDTDTDKACGVAVIFFGYTMESGKFLYLEDLFIEEAYRGRGGGKSVMLALANIAQLLDCGSFKWQALDWNTPSLKFYESIGAKVLEGLLTSRFAGKEALEGLARHAGMHEGVFSLFVK